MTAMPDFASYPTARAALAAAMGFYVSAGPQILAKRLGVDAGVALLAILGIADRSPGAIWAAIQDDEFFLNQGIELAALRSGREARIAITGETRLRTEDLLDEGLELRVPRPPLPTAPVVPLVLARPPKWMQMYGNTTPDGCVVPPDHEIRFDVNEAHSFRLALDGIEVIGGPIYFAWSNPPKSTIRHLSPLPLPSGDHTLTIWYNDADGQHDSYTWIFTVRDEGALLSQSYGMTAIPDFAGYPTVRVALAAAFGFYNCRGVPDLARVLGVDLGVSLLALLGRSERSRDAIWDAMHGSVGGFWIADLGEDALERHIDDLDEVSAVWRTARLARRALGNTGGGPGVVPRLARPTAPTVPLVLAPLPRWLGLPSAPDGSVVAPDHKIEVSYSEAHRFRLALDGVDLNLNGPYFQWTDPPSGSLRHQPPKPLTPGAHTLSTWYEEADGRREIYTWVFTVSEE